jgi:hypothetical protein
MVLEPYVLPTNSKSHFATISDLTGTNIKVQSLFL